MNLRKTLRIARWEVAHNASRLDRRTLAIAGVVVLLVAALAPMAASRGVTLDDGIYRVGVAEDSPYYDPVAADPTFVAVEPAEGRTLGEDVDVRVGPDGFAWADTPKGRAAVAELRTAVGAYNDRVMAGEDDAAAAFPVAVSVRYVERATLGPVVGTGDSTGEATASDEDGDEAGDGTGDTGGTADEGASGDGTDDADEAIGAPSVGTGSSLFADGSGGTPADIAPPFPFESLVLAFAFVLPMNFVIQAYASSVLDERVNRRGELMLVSPVSRGDIVAGKTLPYLLGMVAIAAVTAVGVAVLAPAVDGPLAVATTAGVSVAAVVPVAVVFLASAFVGGMFARSFKELTFVTVTLSVFLTSYVFVPAIFTDVHPVAAISPLTLVVKALRGAGVTAGEYAFATLPLLLSAGVLFALGIGVYREEDMFTQRSVPLKFLDALDSQITGYASAAKLSALSIPFVFVGELLAVALLFALPVRVSVPALLVAVAVVEELAKSVHVYAGFAHGRFERSLRSVVLVGGLSGLGFFLGEKATAVAQVVGLPNLELGRAAFGTATGLGVAASPAVVVALLLAPLALHATTATVSAYGASRDATWYVGTLVVATAVHAGYNLAVVSALG